MNPTFEKVKKTKFMLVWRTIALIILLIISCLLLNYVFTNQDYAWDTIILTITFLLAFLTTFIYIFFVDAQKYRIFWITRKNLLTKIANENNLIIIKNKKDISILINNYIFTSLKKERMRNLDQFEKNEFIVTRISELSKSKLIEKITKSLQEKMIEKEKFNLLLKN